MVKTEGTPSPSPRPPPLKRRRGSGHDEPSSCRATASTARVSAVPWDPREDEIIIAQHRKRPPTPWSKVSELVSALGICSRSPPACSMRWARYLKHDDPTTEKPTEPEQTLLEQAVTEVETGMVDKWWIVALRYQELSKGYDVKEFKKGACKKWWEWMVRQKAEKAERDLEGRHGSRWIDRRR